MTPEPLAAPSAARRFPLIIAHRGASADATENTMAAFRLAHQQGAQMIELDVRASADGAIVVFHDDTTERWNGRLDRVAALPWSQLRQLPVGSEQMPLLDEVCAWAAAHQMQINIEIKAPGIERAVADIVAAAGLNDAVIVSSFYPAILQELRRVAPHLRRGALMGVRTLRPRVRAREALPLPALRTLGAYAWHPAYQLPFLPRIIRAVQRRGYRVNVWTVDDPLALRWLIALGVDGIITNRPALLRDLIAAAPFEPPARSRRRRRTP